MSEIRLQELKFFKSSRDSWKQKHREKQAVIKQLKIKIRDLIKSRNFWKEKAKKLELELKKQKEVAFAGEMQGYSDKPTHTILFNKGTCNSPKHFSYCSDFINFCAQLFLDGNTSYRSCAKICSILANFYNAPAPHYSTIRQWVLRLGYYTLHEPKEKRNDWVYIVDYTITTGKNKCLAILGVSLKDLRKNGFNLKMKDVALLNLTVTPRATWEVTYNALVETVKLTGIPKEIISDHGADVKKGIEEFCALHKKITYIYDVSHLSACCLKSILSTDTKWDSFLKRLSRCKHQTKQTLLSFLSPPSQRAKARYMNAEQMIGWFEKILQYQERGNFLLIAESIVEKRLQSPNANLSNYIDEELVQEAKEMFEEKFNWIQEYSDDIIDYKQYLTVIKTIKKKIITEGLSRKTIGGIKKDISIINLNKKGLDFSDTLMKRLSDNIPKNAKYKEAYLGVSDIIESLFGKYKYYCSESALMGITQSILIISAATLQIDHSCINKAMESNTFMDIHNWSKKTIGESDFSKRCKAFKRKENLKVA